MLYRKRLNRHLLAKLAALVGLAAYLAFGYTHQPIQAASIAPLPSTYKQSSDDNHAFMLPPNYQRALPGAEVLIDVGHGGVDGGAHYENLLEKDINLAIAKRLYLQLRSNGIRTILNRNGDYALSEDNRWFGSPSRHQRDLSQRSQLTKEIQTQIVVSLHVNWSARSQRKRPTRASSK